MSMPARMSGRRDSPELGIEKRQQNWINYAISGEEAHEFHPDPDPTTLIMNLMT